MAIKSKLKVKKTDGTYVITHPETEAAQIVDFPFTMRKNSKQYPLGNIVFCENLPNGLYLLCTKAGSTTTSVPAGLLTATAGMLITDGTLQWQVVSISASGITTAVVAPSNPVEEALWVDTSATAGTDTTFMGTLKKWGGSAWKRIDIATKISQIIDFEAGVKAILYKVAENLGMTWQLTANGYFSFGPYLGGCVIQWGYDGAAGTYTFPLVFKTTCLQVVGCLYGGDGGNCSKNRMTPTSISTKGFTIPYAGCGYRYIAIGY